MDRYFYSVELDDDGNKVVHISGNIYWTSDEAETNYRCAEWTFFYIPMNKLKALIEVDWFCEYVDERIDYLGDLTEEDALEACECYFDGKPGTYLHIADVNEKTPCGHYWFE